MANKQRDAAKERFWRDVLKRRAASGLGVRAFCRREQLAEANFYAWRRTIRARDGQPPPRPKRRPTKRIAFVPAVVTSEPRHEAIVIELVGGRVLKLPEGIAPARLAELVAALEARAAS